MRRAAIIVAVVALLASARGQAATAPPGAGPQLQLLAQVGVQQKVGQRLPALTLTGQDGKPVSLRGLAAEVPLVLVPAWFGCPNLCPMLLHALARATAGLDFAYGSDYRVAVFSIDARDEPGAAARMRRQLAVIEGAESAHWHWLTGDTRNIAALMDALGVRAAYDQKRDVFAHPAVAVVVAPGGRISRYLFGIDPSAPDLRLALMTASRGELGGVVDALLLRCYRYDPATGHYGLAIARLLRLAGGGTVLALAAALLFLNRRGARRHKQEARRG